MRTGMRAKSLLHTLAVILLIMPFVAHASAWPESPKLDAKSWSMIDTRSGQVIASHNPDMQLPPASLTKMMTLYLAFEALKQGRLSEETRVSVSQKAWKIGGSTMFLEPRMHPTVGELLHGIATYSGNDACIALAEHMEGSESTFAERMNAKARELGMLHSHFVNATGFPVDGHYASAGDMALLGAALWRDFPEQYKLFNERDFTYDGRSQPNRNRLLWTMSEADGIKTGHTQEAGYCLVGSAEKESTRFVAAVFGAKSDRARAQETRTLLRFGFNHFVTMRPAERDIRRQVEVFEGTEDQVWLRPASDVWVTVPKGSESSLSFRLRYDAPLKAPIRQGKKLGVIDAVIGEKNNKVSVILSFPMVAANAVEQGSWISRQWDGLRLWLRHTGSDAIESVTGELEGESKTATGSK